MNHLGEKLINAMLEAKKKGLLKLNIDNTDSYFDKLELQGCNNAKTETHTRSKDPKPSS